MRGCFARGVHVACGVHVRARADTHVPHSDPKTNTIHSIFRRAGLVPNEWNKGWDGHVPFVYNPKSSAAEA
jgi:hypothetical protein